MEIEGNGISDLCKALRKFKPKGEYADWKLKEVSFYPDPEYAGFGQEEGIKPNDWQIICHTKLETEAPNADQAES